MTSPSILKKRHRLGRGVTVFVTRVLKGTRESSWGGTRAYQTGIDLLVSIHCPACCCRGYRTVGDCGHGIVPPFRVIYRRDDADAWWSRAHELEAQHLATAAHT